MSRVGVKNVATSKKALAFGLLLAVALVLGQATKAHAAPGDLDATFSGDGKLVTSFGPGSDVAQDVAVQDDGKVVVAGYTDGGTNGDFAVARYNPNGALDANFGQDLNGDGERDGKLITPVGSGLANALAIQPDGKLVVAGISDGDFALVRYNPDGTLDATFGAGGKAITDFGSGSDGAADVAIQEDGKIVAAGGSGGDFALVRYKTDGSLDPTFDADGKVTTDIDSSDDGARAVAIQADGRIVVLGSLEKSTNFFYALACYDPDGSLDTSFGDDRDSDGEKDGRLFRFIFANGTTIANDLALQGDGKIVLVGSVSDGHNYIALARHNPDGSTDYSFTADGGGGSIVIDLDSDEEDAYGVAVQDDGRIVVAGASGADFAVVRRASTGAADATFGSDGKLTTDLGAADAVYAVSIQGDGKIVVAGTSGGNFAVARYYGGSDTTPPKVSAATPTGTRVFPKANVTATFSDPMDEATVEAKGAFTLRKKTSAGLGKPIGASVSYAPVKRKAVLDPAVPLRSGTVYVATVARTARDLSGNALDGNPSLAGSQNKVWKFKVQ